MEWTLLFQKVTLWSCLILSESKVVLGGINEVTAEEEGKVVRENLLTLVLTKMLSGSS
jgi:hypothetical protein